MQTTATLYDVWLHDGGFISLWAYSEDDALRISAIYSLRAIGVVRS
jgi:hypothetical protein